MTANTVNAFLKIDMLPVDFREVHGARPRRFADHSEAASWLDRMADATLASAESHLALAETMLAAGDAADSEKMVRRGMRYIDAHNTIVALRIPA